MAEIVTAPAAEADVDGIVELLFEMDEHYGDEVLETVEQRTRQTRQSLFGAPTAARVVVAKEGDRIVGFSATSLLWPAVGSTSSTFLKELLCREGSTTQWHRVVVARRSRDLRPETRL